MSVFIYDRTYQDVTYAYNNQDSTQLLKGALNWQDLNRIENNILDTMNDFNNVGYVIILDCKIDWVESDIPDLVQITRIRDNVNKLVIKFLSLNHVPYVVKTEYLNYIQLNTLEKNLKLLRDCLNIYGEQNLYCGTLFCGEVQF